MKTIKKASAPVRIDFAGGTTDISPFKDIYGGCVLNATINKRIFGELTKSDKNVGLRYWGNIPTSSGLGTSGVMNLVWLSLTTETKNRLKLAEMVYDLEQSLGQVGGKQDQYASAVGGINFFEFKKDKVKIERLKLPNDFIRKLESHLTLIYTGKPHMATKSNKAMNNNLKSGKIIKNLLTIKKIAFEMRNSLLKKDLDKFAYLMNEETKERAKLHKSIVNKDVKRIIGIGMRNGAVSAKVCGSGNGGSILFFGNKKELKKKFGRKVIDFKFDFNGLMWV